MIIDRLFTLASALGMPEVDLRIKRTTQRRWLVRLDTGHGVFDEESGDPDVAIEKLIATFNALARERRKQLASALADFDAELAIPPEGSAR